MDQIDLDNEEKNIFGGLDRLLVNVGMIIIAVLPTFFYLIFKPKSMCYMLRGEEPDGRQGLKLGPGLTFILTIFVIMAVGYIVRDVLPQSVASSDASAVNTESGQSGGIRTAMSEGNIWRSVILSLPFYLAALIFGVLFHVSHRVIRKASNLTQSVGVGLYILSTLFLLVLPLGIATDHFGADSSRANIIVTIVTIAFFIILPWQIFNFSHHGFKNATGAALLATLFTVFGVLLALIGFGILASIVN